METAGQELNRLNARFFNVALESEIIGEVLNGSFEDKIYILTTVKPEYFSDKGNGFLYKMMLDMFAAKHSINSVSINSFMAIKLSIDKMPFAEAAFHQCIHSRVTDSVHNSVSLIKEFYHNRRIYYGALVQGAKMFDDQKPTSEIIAHMSDVLMSLDTGERQKKIGEVTDNVVDSIINGLNNKDALLTGLHEFDLQFGGVRPDRYYTIGAESGAGKCMAKGTELIMHDGSIKKIEDVKVGDKLMGPDSNPRTVLSLARGQEQMYWVRQRNGNDYRVNESHILSLNRLNKAHYKESVIPGQLHIEKNNRKRSYTMDIPSVHEVVNLSVREFLKLNKTQQRCHYGYKVGVDFDYQDTNIDSYLFGLWIGDGSSHKPAITTTDPEIIDYIMDWSSENGHDVSVEEGITFHIRSNYRNGITSLQTLLRNEGVLGNKSIPQNYIINSREKRLLLLAGLIDSDGHLAIGKAMYEITQKKKNIAESIVFLSRSLGFKTTIRSKNAKMKRKDGSVYECEVYRIHIMSNKLYEIPCRVERKKFKMDYNPKFDHLNTSIKVEKDIVDDYYGFELDGDHLYLLSDFTVTHNTAFLIDMIVRLCDRHKEDIAILFFSIEMSQERVMQRCISHKTGLSNQELEGRVKPLSPDEKKAVREAGDAVRNYPMEVIYKTISCSEMRLKARSFALQNPGKRIIIFLDHIGLIAGATNDLRVNTVEASSTMKSFCADYNASCFVLTQFTKEIDSNANRANFHKPHMGYIMESGRIRQDSDVVLLLWRPETRFEYIDYAGNEKWETSGKMIMLNEKNRDGHAPNDIIVGQDIRCNRIFDSLEIF